MSGDQVQFETQINQLDYLLNVNYIEIPAEIITQLGGMKVRVICTINDRVTFQAGYMALGEGNAYITVNKTRMKSLKLKTGDIVQVKLVKDDSEFGIPMPEELAELLKMEDLGNERFNMLSPGKKRYILYYVNQVKSSQLRIDRAILMVDYLKRAKPGVLDFRDALGLDD